MAKIKKKSALWLLPLVVLFAVLLLAKPGTDGGGSSPLQVVGTQETVTETTVSATAPKTQSGTGKKPKTVAEVPPFDNRPYVEINGNQPNFSAKDKKRHTAYESYAPLDRLGRCGVAFACLCTDTMPTEKRGEIGQVRPSGWHTVKYSMVDGKYLYNRCHLIGYQLSAENANVQNLITGTRYLNTRGMLPFENMVADYIKETGNHVLYRVTPVFSGTNLVANGVEMEAWSVEDQGDGICFHVYCYNNQPGIEIDYATGESSLTADSSGAAPQQSKAEAKTQAQGGKKEGAPKNQVVYTTPSGKCYHKNPNCGGKNAKKATLQQAENSGLRPCKRCAGK